MKKCSKCGLEKAVSEFSQWTNKDTEQTIVNAKCKTCAAKYSKSRYAAKRKELREQMKLYYQANRESAIAKAKAYYAENSEEIKARRVRYYEDNRSTVLLQIDAWRKANPEKVRSMQQRWVNANRDKVRESSNKYARANAPRTAERWRLMRLMVMEHYGGARCSCCGESVYEFLTIDHVNEDGAVHRAAIGQHLYRWLIEHDYPPGFTVLCMNCNCGKHRNGGVCPHKDHEPSTTRA